MLQPHERDSANRIALIGLGSNLTSSFGTSEETIRLAIERLGEIGFKILKVSRFYRTPCFPAGAGPDYINACVQISVNQSEVEILASLHRLEADFGRDRVQRWASRTLDIDLLAVGEIIHPDVETQEEWQALSIANQKLRAPDELILPHPRLQDRAFVLVPLADIAPDWTHPVLGATVREMLERLPEADRAEVVPIRSD